MKTVKSRAVSTSLPAVVKLFVMTKADHVAVSPDLRLLWRVRLVVAEEGMNYAPVLLGFKDVGGAARFSTSAQLSL
jgi:hypothetical protein